MPSLNPSRMFRMISLWQNPGPAKWSILQCVEHVAIAEDYMLSQIGSSKPSTASFHHEKREAFIINRGADRGKPVAAPEVAIPTGRFRSLADGVEYFLAAKERTIQFVVLWKDDDLRSMATTHPLMGPVNCY